MVSYLPPFWVWGFTPDQRPSGNPIFISGSICPYCFQQLCGYNRHNVPFQASRVAWHETLERDEQCWTLGFMQGDVDKA